MPPSRTRTFMIDPRRRKQNEARAEKLVGFARAATKGAIEGDDRAVEAYRALMRGVEKNWPAPAPFDVGSPEALLPPRPAQSLAIELAKDAIEPLRALVAHHTARGHPIVVKMNDKTYKLGRPGVYNPRRALIAPLTSHVCLKLVQDVFALHYAMHDPGPQEQLAVERARYGRERTRLIRLEHWLWEWVAAYDALADRMPYAHRVMLLIAAWHPSAHAPPGAWTLCIRCGDLLYRKQGTFTTWPRCTACMKETPRQREWPRHALAPHDRGTWFLRCQYPECEMVFTGPRHRKLCPEHTSSRLPPRRRLSGVDQ